MEKTEEIWVIFKVQIFSGKSSKNMEVSLQEKEIML